MNILPINNLSNYLSVNTEILAEGISTVTAVAINLIPYWPIAAGFLASGAGVLYYQRYKDEKDAIVQASRLIRDNMREVEKKDILDAIRIIPAAQRNDLAALTLPLIFDDMPGWERLLILDTIQQSPIAEQGDFMARALLLIPSNLDAWTKMEILECIQHLPAAERNQRMERARAQLNIDFPDEAFDLPIYLRRLRELLETPLNEAFLPMGQNDAMAAAAAAGQAAINVHAGSRDARTAQALQLLRQSQQMTPEEIETASKACIKYLEDHDCDRALKVLIGPENPNDYGPFFKPFIIGGIHTSGQEVIGRLWQFIQNLSPEQEKEAALHSMVISLNECINGNGERICSQGKMQHLLIAVLQGRLKGVRIDDSIEIPEAIAVQNAPAAPQTISVEAATEMFFHVEANRAINNLQTLLQAANAFCNENPLVDRESFIQEIKAYAAGSDIQ